MSPRGKASLVAAGMIACALPIFAASPNTSATASQATALRGTLMCSNGNGNDWVPAQADETVHGHLYKTQADGVAVVSLSKNLRVRMSPDTLVRVKSVTDSAVEIELKRGKIMARVPGNSGINLKVVSPGSEVVSRDGVFVVSAVKQQSSLKVVSGHARMDSEKAISPQIPWKSNVSGLELSGGLLAQTPGYGHADAFTSVAYDGPDTRRRPTNEVRNEQRPATNVGEDVPTESPSPTVTETPAFTPSPTFTPPPSPSPPPVEQGAVIEGTGGAEWIIPAVLAGGGLLAYFLSQDDDDDIIIPPGPFPPGPIPVSP